MHTKYVHSEQAKTIARLLLEVQAVNVNTENFFQYVSGILSPIYVDNRRTISFPRQRKVIVDAFVNVFRDVIGTENFDLVAGVASGGVPWAAWVADRLERPLVYVRPAAKERGMKKQVEGVMESGQRLVVVEDLITTGLSSANVVQSIRESGGRVEDCISIFSFDAPASAKRFGAIGLRRLSLTNLSYLLEAAAEDGSLDARQIQKIQEWIETTLAVWGAEAL
jgi:orotate phosphoribosyltransferase